MSTTWIIPLTLFQTTAPVPSKLLKYLSILLLTSSCTVALPEFQTAESLTPRENKVAVGGFSGRGLNASTGAVAVYNRGLTNQLDLTSTTSISKLNIEQNNLRVSAVIGPKWSIPNQKWAISAPMGTVYSETFNDIDAGYTYRFRSPIHGQSKIQDSEHHWRRTHSLLWWSCSYYLSRIYCRHWDASHAVLAEIIKICSSILHHQLKEQT